MPFHILLGDKNYLDGEITTDEIIDYVNKNKVLPKTGAVNEFQFTEHFENILKEYDAVIHFSLSSLMSSAYNNAVSASKKFNNVYIVDSRSLSTGIALLCIYAKELIDDGVGFEDVCRAVEDRKKYVQASFELNRVDYLYKGGRCSMLSMLGANLLRIRPQILVKDGKMVSGKKFRGNFDRVVKVYVESVLEEFNNPDLENVFITYTTADKSIVDDVVCVLKDRGFKNIMPTRAGGTITSHCGENCLGILYINDGGITK